MLICNKCGCSIPTHDTVCPACGEAMPLELKKCLILADEMNVAKRNKEYDIYYKICNELADAGYLPAIREWGDALESGELGAPQLDAAMKFFERGAFVSDAYCAYRYSRLIGRESEERSNFWLLFSAALGAHEAAPAAARLLDRCEGMAEASYYYSLSAKCDNVDSIVTLAKRYSEGIGVPKSDAYAKWYMDKLFLPPIHALGLAYRLRGVRACEPPEPECNLRELILRLSYSAQLYGYENAQARLVQMLSDMGDIESTARLGMLIADGIGLPQDMPKAIKTLEYAAAHGSAEAYKSLGNLYLIGKGCEKSAERAIGCYRHAAQLGMSSAYQLMADIYYDGELTERDVAKAARLYELAANEGDGEARKKLELIVKRRTELYRHGTECERAAPHEAITAYSLSVSMGHLPAYIALAKAYLTGVGVEINRKRAFELLKSAAKLGEIGAYFPLALCYSRGVGVALDYKSAKVYLTRARAIMDKRADAELHRIFEAKRKKLAQRLYSHSMQLLYSHKFELARSSCESAHTLRNAKATYTLGAIYEFGLGTSCDKARAYSLYELAYKNGFRDPRNEYKLSILKVIKKRNL